MPTTTNRPGKEMSTRPLHFIWIVDCSGSMAGEKIQTVNYAVRQAIPEMKSAAGENPNAQLLVRTIRFSNGAQWLVAAPTPVEDFDWADLGADGVTDMGKAFELLSEQMKIPPMPERALPPVLVLITDGQPTDDYKTPLNKLLNLNWGKKAVRIAIAIGQDADHSVLEEFTKNKELVLHAKNSNSLVQFIKWASTLAKAVSQPAVNPDAGSTGPANIDKNSIPVVSDDDADVW